MAATFAPPPTDRRIPRVVFFGPSRSGKTKLVELFADRAADAAPVELTPAGDGPTLQRELIPHLLHIPRAAGPVLVIDCDGRAAGELLASPDALVRGAARGALADAVRTADALVLVVDAAADPEAIDQTFRDFGRFLDGLEEGRTFGREVGGLPVFLTVTKCDTLFHPGQSPTDWLGRVEAAERRVRERFEDFFGDEVARLDPATEQFLPFGSIDLDVHATAAGVPPGEEFAAYADAGGSFGVDALVVDCLTAARAYHGRVESARTRLRWVVGGAGSLVAAMLIGLGVMAGSAVGGDPLANRVRTYQRREGPPAVRFADRALPGTLRELTALRDAAGFGNLPDELQAFVRDRLLEAEAYQAYRAGFSPPRLGPAEVRTREQVDSLTAALAGPLAPPAEYAAAWADTDASKLRAKWLTDLDLLRGSVERLDDWYRGLIRRANTLLLTETPPDATWRREATKLLAEGDAPPVKPEAPVERSVGLPLLRGKPLTYAAAFAFDRVERARRDWQDAGSRLSGLRDLSDALGLTTGPGTPPPVLDLPEPTADGSSSKELAAARLAALRQHYPPDDRPDWELPNFPDPVRGLMANRLGIAADTGVRHVRRLVAAAVGPTADSPDGWAALAGELLREPELVAWGQLLARLDRWRNAPAPPTDPVTTLAAFVRTDRFELTIQSVTVGIPDDLLDPRPQPAGPLVVTHTPAGRSPVEYRFRLEGEPQRERPLTNYTFVADGHPGRIDYRPGDGLTASLPLRTGSADARLVWAGTRTPIYQFDALARPPRLERGGPVPTAEPAAGVRLTVTPPGGLPAVPAVVPDTTGDGR
jgi:hypothetical protein